MIYRKLNVLLFKLNVHSVNLSFYIFSKQNIKLFPFHELK